MGQRLCGLGSIKRKVILDSWKGSIWELNIDAAEANKELLKGKRKSQQQLVSEYEKRLKLEGAFEKSIDKVKKEVHEKQELQKKLSATENKLKEVKRLNQCLTKSNKKLSFAAISHDKPQRRKRQDISSVSRQQQWSRKKQLHSDVSQALLFQEDEGVSASSVVLVHAETNAKEVLHVQEGKFSKQDDTNPGSNGLEVVLYVKEHFGLSDLAYHELSMVCQQLPRSWRLKNLAKQLNSKWEIKPCRGGDGVQQSLKSRLAERVCILRKDHKVCPGDVLKVKLSGDGTKICRKLNFFD